jgi:CRP-like cAMP-binding protein
MFETAPSLLGQMPVAEAEWLGSVLQGARLEAGERLAEAGQPCGALWFLQDAVSARIAVAARGVRRELGLDRPGGMACAWALAGRGTSPWDIHVVRAGSALRLDRARLAEVPARAPSLALLAGEQLHHEAAQLARLFAGELRVSHRTLIAERLLDRFDCLGPQLKITHRELAELIAMRRETVTLALQEIEGAQAIRNPRGEIRLLDRAMLAGIAQQC